MKYVLLFLLIAALVFFALTYFDGIMNVSTTPAPGGDVVVLTPAPSAALPATTPFAAPASTPVPTPVPTPVVTAMPTPAAYTAPVSTPVPTQVPYVPATPVPTTVPYQAAYQTDLGGGSFRSDTGTGLNLVADWTAKAVSQSQVEVTVSLSAVSYSLMADGGAQLLNISLDDKYVTLDSPRIYYDGSNQISSALGSHTFTVDLPGNSSRTMPLQVVWNYRGSYGQVFLDAIECGGMITISR